VLGDLLTLHQLNLPVKIVVFRNNSIDFVELEMKAGGFLDYGTELKNPDFAALAQSAGVFGLKVETANDVQPMPQKAFKHDGPAPVEVLAHRQELSMHRQSLWNKPQASACSCSRPLSMDAATN
jgi:pyruvate dehydrogenase (quinone)